MRIAALILGIVGGTMGIIFSFIAMTVGGAAGTLGSSKGESLAFLGFISFMLAVTGIVGGALSNKKPQASYIMLIGPGVLGFFCIQGGWTLAGIPFIIGGILEFITRDQTGLQSINMSPQTIIPNTINPAQSVFCDQCGTGIDANTRFCPSCGAQTAS
ncbi:MAG: zinc-ribbon domain-containing protein [Thermoleophilia bacterium]